MTDEPRGDITSVLIDHMAGDPKAFDRLVPMVYPQLRAMAKRQMRRMPANETLGTTGLIHEAYLKMVDHDHVQWNDRGHFFAVCARVMRQVVVDSARRQRAQKRGGDQARATYDESALATEAEAERILLVDEALNTLASRDETLVRIVECRFFAGLTEEETAETLGMSLRSAQRGWAKAKLHLKRHMALDA